MATKSKARARPKAKAAHVEAKITLPARLPNGLTPEEDAALRKCSRELGAIYAKRAYLGLHEALGIQQLKNRVDARLDPPSAEELKQKTDTIVASFFQHEQLTRAIEAASMETA